MGHGWPPVLKSIEHGLRPSFSIDVVTTVPGDMFTQMRSAFGSERGRVNEARVRAERAGAEGLPDRRADAARGDHRRRVCRRGRGPYRLADAGQAGRRRDPRRQRDQHGAGHRPGRRRRAVRGRLQRRHRHRRRRVPQARRQAARRPRQGARSRPGIDRSTDRGGGSQGSPHDHQPTSFAPRHRPTSSCRRAGRPAPSGYQRWTVVGEGDGCRPHRLRALPPGARAARCRRTCTPSRRASTSSRVSACSTPPRARYQLGPGDYALAAGRRTAPVAQPRRRSGAVGGDAGVRHRGAGTTTTRSSSRSCAVGEPVAIDVRDPRLRRFGSIQPEHMEVGGQSQELLAVSAACARPCWSTAASR